MKKCKQCTIKLRLITRLRQQIKELEDLQTQEMRAWIKRQLEPNLTSEYRGPIYDRVPRIRKENRNV